LHISSQERVKQFKECERFVPFLVLAITAIIAVNESFQIGMVESYPDYADNVKPYLQTCDTDPIQYSRGHLKWLSICASHHWFGNAQIIPFLYSIVLLPLAYWFVAILTKNNWTGLIAFGITASSGLYYLFNTTATYEHSWVVFLLIALIASLKNKWFALPVFMFAVLSKPTAILFLPMMLYMSTQYKQKAQQFFWILAIITIFTLVAIDPVEMIGGHWDFNPDEFIHGLYGWWFFLDSTMIIAVSIVLVMVALFIKRKKDKPARIILVFIIGIIISVPLIEGFTTQLNHAYRFLPLVIFGGAGLGHVVIQYLTKR